MVTAQAITPAAARQERQRRQRKQRQQQQQQRVQKETQRRKPQTLHEQLKPLLDPNFLAPVPTLTRRRGLHTCKIPLVSRSDGFFDAVQASVDWGDEEGFRLFREELGGAENAAPPTSKLGAYISAQHRQG